MFIKNIFKNLDINLSMSDEIKLYKWEQKPAIEKVTQLSEWNDELGPENNLVKAAEKILELNYPDLYIKYSAMQQKFTHKYPFFVEKEIDNLEELIDWLNKIFEYFGGLQEGLLGGLVLSPAVEGTIISLEYEKGKLARILNKGDGEDAEMIMNAMDIPNIPHELTIKKDAVIRGVVTTEIKNLNKNQSVQSYVNKKLFSENKENVEDLIFIPNELLQNGKFLNTSSMYQFFKDNGFEVLVYQKTEQVIEALDVYQEMAKDEYSFEVPGARIEIENGKTKLELYKIMNEKKLTDYLYKLILLFEE